jgi:hypothetical protein
MVADLRGEGSDTAEVEVKRASRGFPESVEPTLSAFANTPGGGIVIFGLDEDAGFTAAGVGSSIGPLRMPGPGFFDPTGTSVMIDQIPDPAAGGHLVLPLR